MKKYKLLLDDMVANIDVTLYRIIALKDFDDVKKGDLGGYVEDEKNLSQFGSCWIYDDAKVAYKAYVCDNSKIYGDVYIHGDTHIYGSAIIKGNAEIHGNANVGNNAIV